MTREEQIIAEAKKYYSGNIQCYDAFLHGVEFVEEHPINVWHGIGDMPKAGLILCHALNESFEVVYIDEEITTAHWLEFILRSRVQEWLYISDLHPKRFKK